MFKSALAKLFGGSTRKAKVAKKAAVEAPAEEAAKAKAIEEIVRKIASRISPSVEEAAAEKRKAEELSEKLRSALGPEPKVWFVGSAARDTGLRGDRDIDLFVTWPREYEKGKIVEKTFKAAKNVLPAKWVTRYAEHPYLQATLNGYKVEVVPCYKMAAEEKKVSAVDRTVLHMDYLQRHLSEGQRRDVRVLKAMLKAAGIYGAEAEVEGFSGLVCEYLMLNYRSFAGLVEAAKDWTLPVVCDIEGYWKDVATPAEIAKRFKSQFVLVDVIDRERNAAAAISLTNLSKFIMLCRAFWNAPGEGFFEKREFEASPADVLETIEKRDTGVFLIEFPKPEVVPDTLVPQLRHTAKAIAKQLELNSFKTIDFDVFVAGEKCFILIELESLFLSSVERVAGPPVSNGEECGFFLKKQREVLRGPFVDGDRIAVEERRVIKNAARLVERILLYPEMYGVSKNLYENIKQGKIYEGKWVCKSEVAPRLAEYFFKKEAWL